MIAFVRWRVVDQEPGESDVCGRNPVAAAPICGQEIGQMRS
jgi:hypothetical protein